MDGTPTSNDDDALEQLADAAFALLGGRIERGTRCGRGAYGAVWLAREAMTRRRLAVKVVRKDPAGAWLREYTGARHYCEHVRHVHPHLLVIHHLAENDDFFCYSMEAADNAHTRADSDTYQPDTLAFRLRRGEPLPLETVRRLGRQLMDALLHLHDAGLVHRDLKPDNILFVDGEPKIADIGLVSLVHPELSLIGTPGYIPENQMRSAEPDGVSQDVFALGKILYGCLSGLSAGQFPKMPAAASAQKHFAPLNNAILAACHPNPAKRLQNIREFQSAWNAEPRAKFVFLRAFLIVLLGFILISIAADVWFAYGSSRRKQNPPPATTPSAPVSAALPGRLVFQEKFDSNESLQSGLWSIDDRESGLLYRGRRGLRWCYRAAESSVFLLTLDGFELPDTATLHILLGHRGGGAGTYAVLFYNPAQWETLDFDDKTRGPPGRHFLRVCGGRVNDETETRLVVPRKPADTPFTHLALVYRAAPSANASRRDCEFFVQGVEIRVPETQP